MFSLGVIVLEILAPVEEFGSFAVEHMANGFLVPIRVSGKSQLVFST
jgi:hypothetical protein